MIVRLVVLCMTVLALCKASGLAKNRGKATTTQATAPPFSERRFRVLQARWLAKKSGPRRPGEPVGGPSKPAPDPWQELFAKRLQRAKDNAKKRREVPKRAGQQSKTNKRVGGMRRNKVARPSGKATGQSSPGQSGPNKPYGGAAQGLGRVWSTLDDFNRDVGPNSSHSQVGRAMGIRVTWQRKRGAPQVRDFTYVNSTDKGIKVRDSSGGIDFIAKDEIIEIEEI